MGDFEKSQICQEVGLNEDICKYYLIESASDDSLDSSSSSIEMMEDVSSSSSSSLSSSSSSSSSSSLSSSSAAASSCSPLFELSELMAQLPIKRGLSKFYQGKSESFASLSSVKSIEDLEKKASKYCCRSRKSMKLYGQSQRLSPKATIAKNKKAASSATARSSIFSSLGKMSSLMAN